jgi:hypothetical protein
MEPKEFVARREEEKQARIDAHKAATSRTPVTTRDDITIPSLGLSQRKEAENVARVEAHKRAQMRDWLTRRGQPIPEHLLTDAERAAREGGAA